MASFDGVNPVIEQNDGQSTAPEAFSADISDKADVRPSMYHYRKLPFPKGIARRKRQLLLDLSTDIRRCKDLLVMIK